MQHQPIVVIGAIAAFTGLVAHYTAQLHHAARPQRHDEGCGAAVMTICVSVCAFRQRRHTVGAIFKLAPRRRVEGDVKGAPVLGRSVDEGDQAATGAAFWRLNGDVRDNVREC